MKLFDVYPINDINIVKARGTSVWDDKGVEYLDLYGGHAVISIGHTHPHWVKRIEEQLHAIAFYFNSSIQYRPLVAACSIRFSFSITSNTPNAAAQAR